MTGINDKLIALTTLSLAQLRGEWRRLYRTEPPRVSKDLLLRGVAHRLQEKEYGAMSTAIAHILRKPDTGQSPAQSVQPVNIRPGTKLVRSWRDRTITVLVTEAGYIWEGQPYRSLSQIAKAVTGTPWSGPKFFGLTRRSRSGCG